MTRREWSFVRLALFLLAAVVSFAMYGYPPAMQYTQLNPAPVYNIETINRNVCRIMHVKDCAPAPTVYVVPTTEWPYGKEVLGRFSITSEVIEVQGFIALHTIGLVVIAHEVAHYQQKKAGRLPQYPGACTRYDNEIEAHQVSQAYAKEIGQNPDIAAMPPEVRTMYKSACDAE
jgi:hypothetical protein